MTLQNIASKVIQENFKEVAFQEEFLSLGLDTVVSYISSDQIDIDSEKDVFDVSWEIFNMSYAMLLLMLYGRISQAVKVLFGRRLCGMSALLASLCSQSSCPGGVEMGEA